MTDTFSRRRFLSILTAIVTCAAMPVDALERVTWTGHASVVVDMGEIAVPGRAPGGVTVATSGGDEIGSINFQDCEIATSAPMGTMLDPENGLGHTFDYRDETRRPDHELLSVSASTATMADGLSTALCLMPRADIQPLPARFPDARPEVSI